MLNFLNTSTLKPHRIQTSAKRVGARKKIGRLFAKDTRLLGDEISPRSPSIFVFHSPTSGKLFPNKPESLGEFNSDRESMAFKQVKK
mmetsp:Transcript_9271/g.12096  ORF Transcript_9271/g.12096 Transcript_9271/m.12096 type:complete len:87 (+) Transcript_9271:1641-1901(+)